MQLLNFSEFTAGDSLLVNSRKIIEEMTKKQDDLNRQRIDLITMMKYDLEIILSELSIYLFINFI